MFNRTFSLVVLSALASGAAFALCVVALTPAPAPETSQPVDLAPLLFRLDEVARRTDDLEKRVEAGLQFREAVETPEVETPAGLGGVGPAPSGSAPDVPRDTPQDWQALYALTGLADADYESAVKDIVLLTVPGLVGRFGFPSKVEDRAGRLNVYYHRLRNDGEVDGWVLFTLNSGYVAGIQWHGL